MIEIFEVPLNEKSFETLNKVVMNLFKMLAAHDKWPVIHFLAFKIYPEISNSD